MTFQKVAEMLAEYKGIAVETVKAECTFAELQLDSLDVAELVMGLEDAFGVAIELDEQVKTVGDMVARIDEASKA